MPDVESASARRVAGHAKLGRFGLGHSLLAWARCYLWTRDQALPMLAPRWRQLRLGPYLRGERDKRQYQAFFHYPGYVRGLRRAAWLALARSVNVEDRRVGGESPLRPELVVFRNDRENNTRYFRELFGRHEELRAELFRVTRPEHHPARPPASFIAMHVRRGDFQQVSEEQLRSGEGNARLPLHWYVAMLRGLRHHLGEGVSAVVFTDGSAEEVGALLAEPAVSLAPQRSAIHDLLSMSQALVLAGSASGMTMWGSFLGQVPRVSYPGQRKERLLVAVEAVDLEPECESAGEITAEFAASVRARMRT